MSYNLVIRRGTFAGLMTLPPVRFQESVRFASRLFAPSLRPEVLGATLRFFGVRGGGR